MFCRWQGKTYKRMSRRSVRMGSDTGYADLNAFDSGVKRAMYRNGNFFARGLGRRE